MMLNTYEAAQQHKGKSEETESQDYIMNTDTYVQRVCESAVFLTLLTEQDKTDNDDERLSNTEFAAEEKELEYYADLAQK